MKCYEFDGYRCSSCLKCVPFTVQSEEGFNICLAEYPVPQNEEYLILESMNSRLTSRVVYVLSPQANFTIGRGEDSDLQLADVTCSEQHARVEYREEQWWLTDCQSMYGTGVLLR